MNSSTRLEKSDTSVNTEEKTNRSAGVGQHSPTTQFPLPDPARWNRVTGHTATCQSCGKKSKTTLYRCKTCVWAICTFCLERNGGSLEHRGCIDHKHRAVGGDRRTFAREQPPRPPRTRRVGRKRKGAALVEHESEDASPGSAVALVGRHISNSGPTPAEVVLTLEDRTATNNLPTPPSKLVVVFDDPMAGLWSMDRIAMPLYISVPTCFSTYFQPLDHESFFNLHLQKGYHHKFSAGGFLIYKGTLGAMETEEVYRVLLWAGDDR
jgi:hypothetical protein